MKQEVDYAALKAGGIIKQKQPDLFSVRVRVPFGNIETETLRKLTEIADKYGRGKLHITVRQGFEIPYVHLKDIDIVSKELKEVGLTLGACGPRVRVIVACQGNQICQHALGNSIALAEKLDAEYYGQGDLPHKFKMAVTGCPNACAKPHENDLGFVAVAEPELAEPEECIECGLCEEVCTSGACKLQEGHPTFDYQKCFFDGKCIQVCPTGALRARREGWNAILGGKFGKQPQLGRLFASFLSDKQAVTLVSQIIKVYQTRAKKGERLAELIDRIGFSAFREAVNSEVSKSV
jgi:dissimilatory sulfite reductase (desulfoviridin) alpha/beta subunit